MESTLPAFCCGKVMEPDDCIGNMYRFKCQDPNCGKTQSKHKSGLHPLIIAKFSRIKK